MKVVDAQHSEKGPQRLRSNDGKLLHCCCICGHLGAWSNQWCCYHSILDLDSGEPIAKFCSDDCLKAAGAKAENVTTMMKRAAREAEFREPEIIYRDMTDREKYAKAAYLQHKRQRCSNSPT